MRQRDWIVIGAAVAIMAAGIGIGIALRYSRLAARQASRPAAPPHHQRTEQIGQAAALQAQKVRQQRAEAMRTYEKMSPGQRRELVRDQVQSKLEPNAPPRQTVLEADQNEVAQMLEKMRGMTPDQRREYLRGFIEQERARLATRQGLDVNRPAEANVPASAAQN